MTRIMCPVNCAFCADIKDLRSKNKTKEEKLENIKAFKQH